MDKEEGKATMSVIGRFPFSGCANRRVSASDR
jgi:hypothetical protein